VPLRAIRHGLAFAALLGQELILAIVETGSLETVEGIGEVKETAAGGHGENGECPCHPESLIAGRLGTTPFIDEEQIGVNLHRQRNRGLFAVVEANEREIVLPDHRAYLKPGQVDRRSTP
jgi:hypothetical protein